MILDWLSFLLVPIRHRPLCVCSSPRKSLCYSSLGSMLFIKCVDKFFFESFNLNMKTVFCCFLVSLLLVVCKQYLYIEFCDLWSYICVFFVLQLSLYFSLCSYLHCLFRFFVTCLLPLLDCPWSKQFSEFSVAFLLPFS